MNITWNNISELLPEHQDLVLVSAGIEGSFSLPAIYYNNNSFKGFYKFTAFYHTGGTPYDKVHLKKRHIIENVLFWAPIPLYRQESSFSEEKPAEIKKWIEDFNELPEF